MVPKTTSRSLNVSNSIICDCTKIALLRSTDSTIFRVFCVTKQSIFGKRYASLQKWPWNMYCTIAAKKLLQMILRRFQIEMGSASLWLIKRNFFRFLQTLRKTVTSVRGPSRGVCGSVPSREITRADPAWAFNSQKARSKRGRNQNIQPETISIPTTYPASNNSPPIQRDIRPVIRDHDKHTTIMSNEAQINQNSTEIVLTVANKDTVNGNVVWNEIKLKKGTTELTEMTSFLPLSNQKKAWNLVHPMKVLEKFSRFCLLWRSCVLRILRRTWQDKLSCHRTKNLLRFWNGRKWNSWLFCKWE